MFTEGLDTNAVRWAREQRQVPASISGQRPWMDPVSNIRNGGRGFGLPPHSKFRSGHLPSGVIPASRAIHGDADDSGFGSDMDETTDTEEEIYSGRYSIDSSPPRYTKPLSKQTHYTSDTVTSDFSSSRETVRQRQGNGIERPVRGTGNKYPVGQHDDTEDDESSDSAMSSEFPSSQIRNNNSSAPRGGTYTSEGYASSVPSQANVEIHSEKDFCMRNLQTKKLSDDDVPSAPPFSSYGQETNQAAEKSPTSRAHGTPCTVESNGSSIRKEPSTSENLASGVNAQDKTGNKISDLSGRFVQANVGDEAAVSSGSLPARLPTFHASGQGPWYAVISYDACVRLCLNSWARGCMEAPIFLENECALLRNAFGLQQVLLQSEEELLANRSSKLVSEGAAPKPKKTIGKMKVQVRKVKMALDPPTGCSFSSLKSRSIKMESLRYRVSNLQSTISSGCEALRRVRVVPRIPANGSFSRHSLAYVQASTQYIKQVSSLLKVGVTTLRNSSASYEAVQETYSCLLRLKSSTEEDAVRMQPGSGETHVFFPDSLGDDLIIEVQDSKGKYYGRVLAQVATITEDSGEKLRWWCIYREPEHELVGRIQLYINYSTSPDENGHLKCGSVAETVAYDLVLEIAMKIQHFQQRKLLLDGPWKWLLTEFASYYGVSDAYTKLRYLSYVMDVATPTADCLVLVHDLLLPVLMKGRSKNTLSHQENRILGEIEDQIEQIFALVFENYKSLDESFPSGMVDVFRPAIGSPAPALAPAIKLYTLLHDILSPETQLKLCGYFQVAAKKRSRRHLAETDEFVAVNSEGTLMDAMTLSTAYQKMKHLCLNIRNEVFTDMEIHNHHVLPSFIDLPNISSSIYSVELCSRLRAFLVACPPTGPSPHVVDLVIATADFQRDLASWNINSVKGGVDAKELFHLYIILWVQDKRLSLLESCKLDKIKWSGVRTQHSTTPFVDDMYERLKETLSEYETIICRWPEYTFVLENAIADVEKAIVESLDKQYADVLSPLKDNLAPKKFGLKYIQKLANRSVLPYTVPEDLGILLNSMKRMLDVLRPRIETQFKSWGSCIPSGGSAVPGERLSEITVMLRTKFRNYLQAVVEKLAENTRMQSATKLKKIIQDSKETAVESDVRSRMQPLKDQLTSTMSHLHNIFETHVFVAICRGYWDRMGQDVLSFLENRKENRSWYKGSRVAVAILDDTFASQLQQLLGNALQEKDLEPPRSIMEVRSMLCKDAPNHKDSNYYY
ncbi:hypothetical protein BVC80_9075g46 [Macleaya cordata]|uniref:Pesticidal crystal cry8Ba protein n=1 Tax=Macleaya cordata TaxID=56857 RepID=A0A200PUA8_MACCD|nr:hypothetical protein BVC80_9075g46 [Macleaya cordata]